MKGAGLMNKSEAKYYNTSTKMDNALIELLDKKAFEDITVKELCERAGVNRSTFYLHYENMGELLEESMVYTLGQFNSYFTPENGSFVQKLRDCPIEELYLITPQYLVPYLRWVSEHQKLLTAMIKNAKLFKLENVYKQIFDYVISPIFDRFGIPEQDRRYKAIYYINGIVALVGEWLKSGCSDSLERMAALIQDCVMSGIHIEKHFPQYFVVQTDE